MTNTVAIPIKMQMRGQKVADLHDALKVFLDHSVMLAKDEAARRKLSAAFEGEQTRQYYGGATRDLVKVFQQEMKIEPTGEVDEATANSLNALLKDVGVRDQPTESAPTRYQVEGKVFSGVSASVGGLRVAVVDKGVGGDAQLAQSTTDDEGAYQATFSDVEMRRRGKTHPDLQARVFVGDVFVGTSNVCYNASQHETLNVLLDDSTARALQSEYETLTGTLAHHFKGKLGDLKETDERNDITYLANKSGWDARAVALAALADQFSSRTKDPTGAPTISQPFFYALFRAGLPANEDTLYQTEAKTLEAMWKNAVEQGVIPKASLEQIPKMIGQFQVSSAKSLLTGPALVGASSFKEMLTISRLNEQQQANFAELYAANRNDMAKFWDAVSGAFGAETAKRLQVDGKLGFLTINNAPLMQKIHATAGPSGLSDPLQLVQLGYHQPQPWSQLLNSNVQIPKEIPGDTPELKRANYASYLAAQVRLSYPTAAVAQMVKSGELPLTGAASDSPNNVHRFLTEHQGKFEICVQPVEQYIAQNNLHVSDETVKQLKRLQRVYQITPSDQAMIGLMKRGIDAAYHVVRYDRDTFVRQFAADLGGADNAALTYGKSVQVHNAVLNIALSYLTARTAPAIGVHSPPKVLDPAPAYASDVIAYATLEKLFGSMDFCACEHCRSVLSPAAYLVDLLQFIGPDQDTWTQFTTKWKTEHGGAPYPYTDSASWISAGQPTDSQITPLDVLLSRRPDIQNLPLTCENTNTALPYIDVVNETLEYFVANSVQPLSLNNYTGHDTSGISSEDLLVSPQFVMDSAYTILQSASFPTPLPFHQALENLLRYFNKFEVPLPLAMERLRKTDDLEHGASPYGWRDILMEEIGLSRTEHEILTDSNTITFPQMYGFPGGTPDPNVITSLSNAKQFAHRLDVTYEDLVSLLKTRFINPYSDLIPKLERLSVSFATLKAFKNGTITDLPLPSGALAPDPSEYGGDIKAWVKNDANYTHIMGLITLATQATTWIASKAYDVGDCVWPTAPPSESTLYYECKVSGKSGASEPVWPLAPGVSCTDGAGDRAAHWTCRDASAGLSFDNLAFRYSDPAKYAQNISSVEFGRLLRFIRLWKKLGWTIEQTDAAICALYRSDMTPLDPSDIDTLPKLDAVFLTLLPRLGIVNRVLKALNLTNEHDLLPLLACWSEISIHGDTALYRQMFLNPVLLKQDPDFDDDGYGEFLTGNKKLAIHSEALRSAFNLTGDEYDRIVAALGYDGNTLLTIPNVSAIFRRGWLARKLQLSVRELLLLTQLTGLNPFAPPDPTNPAILRLMDLVQSMKDRSFKSEAALYLIWNQDLSGKSAPAPTQIAELARTLRNDFSSIDDQFAASGDANGDIARARVMTVYGQDASDAFFALLDDTVVVDVAYTHSAPTLEPAITTADTKIAYDDFRHRLSHKGLATATVQTALKNVIGVSVNFQKAVDALYAESEQIEGLFFTRYPELKPPYDIAVAQPPADRHSAFLVAFQPELARIRKRQQASQRLSVSAGVDLAFAKILLDPSDKSYPLHADGDQSKPALEDALSLQTTGLAAQFFFRDTATGNVDLSVSTVANLTYATGTPNALPANPTPGMAISGVWTGQVEAPAAEFYNFIIEADGGAAVTLTLGGQVRQLTQNGNVWRNTDPIELKAGTLYSISLKVEKVKDTLSLQWETPTRIREGVPPRYLYPPTFLAPFSNTYIRFLKAASLAVGLGLSANEIAHFAKHPDYQIAGDGWLNALSVTGDPAPNTASALLEPFKALLDFGRIKADISPVDESLLSVLKDPASATQNTDSLLFSITRWNQDSLNSLLGQFLGGNVAALGQFDSFRRVYDAFALVQKMGISAAALIKATTNDPKADTVRDFQAALRARYDPASWRDVIRPINDEMRTLQQDALVAYILHQMLSHQESAHIDTPEKLFEYFLMDVQMDPCMQTSRVRHALSSIQLFIERCLMNLEPRVSPAAINPKQWEWMKRYRVWEANRKVYLFPEDWLEPELRDDKSPFFKEIESELLQSDITDERAATALLNYLSKLEEVAKLEPCGIYHIPANAVERMGEINHVVARTAGARRKYYYRRYDGGSWTPWEEVKLDIEDNPVIPVVWNDRLFLFWLRILRQSPLDPNSLTASPVPPQLKDDSGNEKSLANITLSNIKTSAKNDAKNNKVLVQAALCWSEYYNAKWQPTKISDVDRPVSLGSFSTSTFDRSSLTLWSDEPEEGQLRLSVYGENVTPQAFLLYNTHSLPQPSEPWGPPPPSGRARTFISGGPTFTVDYHWMTAFLDDVHLRDVLVDRIEMATVQPNHDVSDIWDAPFFFEDRRNVFYVTTDETPVWVGNYVGFGVSFSPYPGILSEPQIPKLVPQPMPPIPPKGWDVVNPSGPDLGVINSSPMQRFVTEDAYIRQGIGSASLVLFGDKKIGPSGSVMNRQAGI